MTLTKTIEVGTGLAARAVIVRELTVGEVRAWLKRAAESTGGDLVDDGLIDEIALHDLVAMTDLRIEQLDELTPNQVRQLLAACQEVNKDFFALRERVAAVGRRLLDQLSNSSNGTPAP